uniref:Uncharacterized protein n=1 Tax=Glossina pallidipes TaxID=7398 RepID=A0A1A9Z538_GLOPL
MIDDTNGKTEYLPNSLLFLNLYIADNISENVVSSKFEKENQSPHFPNRREDLYKFCSKFSLPSFTSEISESHGEWGEAFPFSSLSVVSGQRQLIFRLDITVTAIDQKQPWKRVLDYNYEQQPNDNDIWSLFAKTQIMENERKTYSNLFFTTRTSENACIETQHHS